MYLTPLQDWRHTLTYKSRNDDPLDDGKEELCMLTATFWSAQSNTARELELFFFFFFRFSQTGLVGTGVHGCRERGALNMWWGHTCGPMKTSLQFMVSIQPQDQNCEKRPTALFPSAVLCCCFSSEGGPCRQMQLGSQKVQVQS